MTILFWDIDGTLLTTGKAGVPAWEAAVREVTGKDFQLSSIRVPGLTDFQIAARTFELLGVEAGGGVNEEQIFVIGDTPHDIECATSIDARTIAVATGGYSLEELAAHRPWKVLAELPPPAAFMDLIAVSGLQAAPTRA